MCLPPLIGFFYGRCAYQLFVFKTQPILPLHYKSLNKL